MDFSYTFEQMQLQICPNWDNYHENLTRFDKLLMQQWNAAVDQGLFKYTLKDCKYKTLQKNNIQFAAQLNPQRAFNRRKNEVFDNMNAKFSDDQFNFTKIESGEILLSLHPGSDTAVSKFDNNFIAKSDNLLAINISPIDNCHVLFVPELNRCLPQKMTASSLLMAFDLLQLSGHPGFRVGFNSIHAWASINHLHYHAMYLDYPLYLDTHPASTHVKSHCYLLDDFAVSGFLFNIPSSIDERIQVAKEACLIVDVLHSKEISYSVVITRGSRGARLVIFPRQSTKGMDKSPCFDVACAEISGQFPIKTEEEFNNLNFDKAYCLLRESSLSNDHFSDVLQNVKEVL